MGSDSGEFQDWELLHSNSDSDSESGFGDSAHNDLEEFDAHPDGMIQANYFCLEAGDERFLKGVSGAAIGEECSDSSDNPSWIEPRSEIQSPRKESTEFWSDSGSDRADELKFSEFEGKSEVGLVGNDKVLGDFEGIEEINSGNGKDLDDFEKMCSESHGMRLEDVKVGDFEENREVILKGNASSEVNVEEESSRGGNPEGNVEVVAEKVEDAGKKTVVWWKVPMEFLKYCVFRVNPVWTFSMAAAVMGFVILGRRLYNMKKKTRSLQLKIAMDDKKVSQFMSRAARLNEAFSVVKRVPVIRPTLPAAGVTPWPIMSLR